DAGVGRTNFSEVAIGSFRKGSCRPAFHPGCRYGDKIHAAVFDRRVSTDGFEALAPEELARSGDMVDTDEPVVVLKAAFGKWRPGHAKARHLFKTLEQEGKVVRSERNVRVEIADDVVRQGRKPRVAVV